MTIDARQEQKHVVVEVGDHGMGLPSESVHRMFQPYAHFTSSKGKPYSIGLGLHVARRLARLMEGELTYREGNRTVFASPCPSASPDPFPHTFWRWALVGAEVEQGSSVETEGPMKSF